MARGERENRGVEAYFAPLYLSRGGRDTHFGEILLSKVVMNP